MKNNTPIFRGIATALITPLTADGIDYAQFGKLIDWQIDQGINALVICGTTGRLHPQRRRAPPGHRLRLREG